MSMPSLNQIGQEMMLLSALMHIHILPYQITFHRFHSLYISTIRADGFFQAYRCSPPLSTLHSMQYPVSKYINSYLMQIPAQLLSFINLPWWFFLLMNFPYSISSVAWGLCGLCVTLSNLPCYSQPTIG